MSEWKGQTALVTGASYGIGTAFARKLAADGVHLILTARSHERLEALASELRGKHRVNVTLIAADLAQPEAPQFIFDEVQRQGLQVDLLVNNAGFGAAGDFAKLPEQLNEARTALGKPIIEKKIREEVPDDKPKQLSMF